jgi:hypothetical protein
MILQTLESSAFAATAFLDEILRMSGEPLADESLYLFELDRNSLLRVRNKGFEERLGSVP